ncbi:MAG: efflux RND transporter periplasmic adaptor subunit [Rhodanobacter sp.]|mgnify:FL=1|jgi:cobalt-zinc-cadmium efflux system membrane fusion protein|nr:efflux RND transporter periplasmic adaptor subunit [Rhodanobacter sp.]MBN8947541.1 efflux RND transporter periplasmic adaptor subunit [Rhodanobacter sp.]MBZ0134303.1 efflux RND transporter periplasmic adaptor subunit [Rhodanobacter sp.]ODT92290.1 MAG: efflux transporter periplasmic adaptor subunit [Rhodanobacter sp. SCN 67-45]OJW31136.1 MAG: efflux transporter periplasmic adaptor subunit [Rhodanobacter sp. 67-28]
MNCSLLKRSLLGMTLLAALAGPVMAQELAPANPLALDAKAIKDAGIVLDKAAPRTLTDELKAPGEVKADAYSTVLVSPRVESQVLARKATLGDVVKAGAPLVVLSSVQVAETQGALIVAEQDWQRIAALGPQAVSARRYNEAKVQRDQARAKLRAYGLSDGQIGGLLRKGSAGADGSFELLAPAAGRVTTDEFLVGERVEPGRTLFTLVKEDSVWVVAQMSPADAERVKPDADARILVHDTAIPGKVVQRSHQTDERTRTVPVRIEVDNRKDLLHPGELVEARIVTGSAVRKLAVPAEAIVLLQNQPTVFLAKGNGQFEPAPVMVGDTRDGWTAVTQGLKAGDTYVRKGAFALKARLLRSQLGEE